VVERGVVGVCRRPWTILQRHSFIGSYSLLCDDVVACVLCLCRVDEVCGDMSSVEKETEEEDPGKVEKHRLFERVRNHEYLSTLLTSLR